ALEPEDGAVEINVLASCEVGMEACAELEERADSTAHRNAARGRLDDRRDDAEQRALARAVAADEGERAPGRDRERDIAQRPHIRRARAIAQEHDALQRPRAALVDAEAAGQVFDDDLALRHSRSFLIITASSPYRAHGTAGARPRSRRRASRSRRDS